MPAPRRGSSPRAMSARSRRTADGGSTPRVSSRGSARTSSAGPSRATRPASSATTRSHRSASRSVLCSATSNAVPDRARPRSAVADQPRTLRVELGRRLVEDQVRGAHREQGRDHDELALPAGQAPRFTLGQILDPEQAQRLTGARSIVSRGEMPRFIGPIATSSKTVPVTPESCVVGVLEPDRDPRRELVDGLPGHRLAVDPQATPGQRPADRPGRQARGDETERRLAGLVGTDDADKLTILERQVDVLEDRSRVARVPIADAAQFEHRVLQPAGEPRDVAATRPRRRNQRRTRSHVVSPMAHSNCRRPGLLNALDSSARLRSSTSVREDSTTGPTSGRIPRRRAQTLPSVSRPRARWLSEMTPARSTRLGAASIVATATKANRGETPRRSRSKTKARGGVVRMNRPSDSEIANRRTTVWAAKSTPSRVASNGPISNSDCRAGPREDAHQHDRDRDRDRAGAARRERAAAGRRLRRRGRASGPR